MPRWKRRRSAFQMSPSAVRSSAIAFSRSSASRSSIFCVPSQREYRILIALGPVGGVARLHVLVELLVEMQPFQDEFEGRRHHRRLGRAEPPHGCQQWTDLAELTRVFG